MDSLVHGTLLLLGAGILTRVLGFFGRVLVARTLGPQGMGLLAMSGAVFWLAVTVATAGMSVAVSRVVADRAATRPHTLRHVMRSSATAVTGLSVAIALVLGSAAWPLRHLLFADTRAVYPLLAQLPALVCIAGSVVWRGVFLGLRRMAAPAAASVLETLVRLACLFTVVPYLFRHGLPPWLPAGIAGGATGTALAFTAGEAAGLLCLVAWPIRLPRSEAEPAGADPRPLWPELVRVAVPVTLTRVLSAVGDFLDAALIPRRLELAGLSRRAATSFLGSLTGLALPLLAFPLVITGAMSQNLVPAVAEAWAKGDVRRVRRHAERALAVTVALALPTTAVFLTEGRALAQVLYGQPEVGSLLAQLAVPFPLVYLEMVLTAILRGMDAATVPTVNGLVGSATRLLVIYVATPVPTIGPFAVVLAVALDMAISFALNLVSLARRLDLVIPLRAVVIRPLLASALLAGVLLLGQQTLARAGVPDAPRLVLATAAACAAYAAVLAATGGLPGGASATGGK